MCIPGFLFGGGQHGQQKNVRIVITGDSKLKTLEEAKKWVLHLEKEVLEERRNYRTLELILLGAIPDEDTKFRIYEQFIEIEFHVFEGELVGLFHRPS